MESSNIEYKTSFNDELIETLTAFANTTGGKVLLGVKNDGSPVNNFTIGDESIQQWLNEIKNKTQPAIIPDVDILDYKNNEIIEFRIPEFPVKPVACRGRYFKRVKNSNHQLSSSEISDLYMQTMQYSWDSYPYMGAGIIDLNFDKIDVFIEKVNKEGRFQLPTNPEQALKKLRMIDKGLPTNAAMILFSKENLLHNVHIGRFKTPSFIIADKMINGNLYDVLEESMQTIIGHLKFAFEITGRTTKRTEIPEYPLDAIREVLLNCLVHRDYRNPSDIQIKIFDQEIIFYNPGGLYGNINEEELHTDVYRASTRNKQLAEAFYLTHDIEKYGSGFIRVRKAIEKYPTMTFSFRNLVDAFETRFSYIDQKISTEYDDRGSNVTNDVTYASEKVTNKVTNVTDGTSKVTDGVTDGTSKVTYKVTENQKLILQILKNNNTTTTVDLSSTLGISVRKIKENIKKMKNLGLLERIGPAKGGYWKVNM